MRACTRCKGEDDIEWVTVNHQVIGRDTIPRLQKKADLCIDCREKLKYVMLDFLNPVEGEE